MPKETQRDKEVAVAAVSAEKARGYWKSLDELAESDEYERFLEDEFPHRDTLLQFDRRSVLKLMGASMLLAGAGGCRQMFLPQERIVPYVNQPEDLVQGVPLYFATACSLGGYATGIVVESNMGRPTKVEGNPTHPASLGATDLFTQASILGLYDPNRSAALLGSGDVAEYAAFLKAAREALDEERRGGGSGLRLLTGTVTSPTLIAEIRALLAEFPAAKWVQYEPVCRDAVYQGTEAAFGVPVEPNYHFQHAQVVLTLDADIFHGMPGCVRYAHDFAKAREIAGGSAEMNRLYAVEASPSLTGASADHVLRVKPSDVERFARALASRLGVAGVAGALPPGVSETWMNAVVNDLMNHRGACVVVPGEYQPAAVHALAHAINHSIGAVGSTVHYIEALTPNAGRQLADLAELASSMKAGAVTTLIVIGGNPAFDAPADFGFAEAMRNVRMRIHVGPNHDDTAVLCDWHVPETHYLEAWGDARAFDGTVSIVQPLIAPIFKAWSAIEVVNALRGPVQSGYEVVKSTWRRARPSAEFDHAFDAWLNEGIVPGSAAAPVSVSPVGDLGAAIGPEPDRREGIEIALRPDPTIWDGRFVDNGWLQECPKQITTLTWDNAAYVSPKTAATLRVRKEDMLELRVGDAKVKAGVWIVPGHADDSVTVHFGYGAGYTGEVGKGAGFDAYPLRRSAALWTVVGAAVSKTSGKWPLAAAQDHNYMEARDIIREGTLDKYREEPGNFEPHTTHHGEMSMYPEKVLEFDGPQWGMSIDLNACTGCGACVVACQAENNIPIVGRKEVMKGREMHWMRIDRYYRIRLTPAQVQATSDQKGDIWKDADDGFKDRQITAADLQDSNRIETAFMPMLCQHCELAPCEPVCPVAATTHSHDGLNQMVYNRCVGTRYCSNNCPYKVRRFNFFNYADKKEPALLRLVNNPNVTVRGRGVMEKCTYCVQRISRARITAKKQGREIADGEVVTACQQACPAKAITFGNVADPQSAVSQRKKEPRDYVIIGEINTRPRTTYLARLRNPNPELENA